MPTVEQSVEVNVPVRTAYNQWTQFEEFPQFMEGVERVEQKDDTHLEWTAEILGATRTWMATITEQIPDDRIAWRADGEVKHGGVVTFHRLDDNLTRVMLQFDYEAETMTEKLGGWLGIVKGRIAGDMARFKEFIESRGTETGAWRGEVEQKNVS